MVKKNWERSFCGDMYDPVGGCYEGTGVRNPLPRLARIRRLLQVMLAFSLMLLMLFLSVMDNSHAKSLRNTLSYYLTDNNADWTPMLVGFVKNGLWADTFENGVLEAFFQPDGVPVISETESMSIPVSGSIVRDFGWETAADGRRLLHPGIDIHAADTDAPVRAALDGEVRFVGRSQRLGKYLEIAHGGNLVTVYGRCSEILVSEGQKVKKGEMVASMGPEGETVLHFEVRVEGKAVDPVPRIKTEHEDL